MFLFRSLMGREQVTLYLPSGEVSPPITGEPARASTAWKGRRCLRGASVDGLGEGWASSFPNWRYQPVRTTRRVKARLRVSISSGPDGRGGRRGLPVDIPQRTHP